MEATWKAQRDDIRLTMFRRRAALGLSCYDVARRMEVALGTVGRMENRFDDGRLSRFQRWAGALGLHLRVSYSAPSNLESDAYNEALKKMYAGATYGSHHFYALERAMAIHTLTLARRSRGISGVAMGRLMGLHSSSISSWENSPEQDPFLRPIQHYGCELGMKPQILITERSPND